MMRRWDQEDSVSNTVAAVIGIVALVASLIVAALFVKDTNTLTIISTLIISTAIPALLALLQANKAAATAASIESKTDDQTHTLTALRSITSDTREAVSTLPLPVPAGYTPPVSPPNLDPDRDPPPFPTYTGKAS
jgi:hypothetical protein